ncbi:response regulator [Labilibacter sediminis]|nr:response regulator [Labilibacter sediminis]
MRSIRLTIFFFVLTVNCSQVRGIDILDNTIANLTYKDGLSDNNVNCIAQDTTGFIWIGTRNGLNRYDGFKVKSYFHDALIPNSISDNHITAIHIDPLGTVWVGTQNNGLCKYNPLTDSFIHYKGISFQDSVLSHPYVTDICDDTYGNLWVSTAEGINLYHKEADYFEPFLFGLVYKITDDDINRLSHLHISDGGLKAIYKLRNKIFSSKYDLINNLNSIAKNKIPKEELSTIVKYAFKRIPEKNNKFERYNSICSDNSGNLWLAFREGGFAVFNTKTCQLEHISIPSQLSSTSSPFRVSSLLVNNNKLWISTRDKGIYIYSITDKTFTKIQNDVSTSIYLTKQKQDIFYYSNQKIYKFANSNNTNSTIPEIFIPEITYCVSEIFIDKEENIWVASNGDGVFIAQKKKNFTIWDKTERSPVPLSKKAVSSLHHNDGFLYVGYYNNNIDQINLSTQTLTTLRDDSVVNSEHLLGSVYAINNDDQGNLWVGSYFNGLQKINKNSSQTEYLYSNNALDFRSFTIDNNNNLWAASHGYGLLQFDSTGVYKNQWHVDYDNWINSLCDDWLTQCCVDTSNILWIASSLGLCKFDTSTNEFTTFKHKKNNPSTISHDNIITVYCDVDNNIWVGTPNGLNLFNRYDQSFTHFTDNQVINNVCVNSIIEDHHKNLWLGTKTGILHILLNREATPEIKNVHNYSYHSGANGENFPRAVTKDTNNNIYFGGKHGITWFNPDEISPTQSIYKVEISDIRILNKSIFSHNSPYIEIGKSFYKNKSITLNYEQNILSIDFTAFNFLHNNKIQYSTFLEGFNNSWQEIGSDHKATYTNLKPGTYTFIAKASPIDEDEIVLSSSIEIIVLPPFFKSNLGILTISSIILLILFLSFYIIFRWFTLQKSVDLKQIEANKLKELDRSKSIYFTNITHEFRTPITLIQGPINSILKDTQNKLTRSEITTQLKLVKRNTALLLRLVNQILDFKKVDAGKISFHPTYADIIPFITKIAESFIPMAKEQHISFDINFSDSSCMTMFDTDKMEKIIYNLLSNAFKYTTEGESISIRITIDTNNSQIENSSLFKIIVKDSGIGIPKDNLSSLFSLYYQAENANTTDKIGNGIGLYLVKTYTELHGGKVYCESTLNKGSVFTVEVPIKSNLTTETFYHEPNMILNKHNTVEHIEKTKILLVEDNVDIQFFIKNQLKDSFNIITTNNGADALEQLKTSKPDIIISDIMMPVLDGYELCKQVKKNVSYCHIPFIMISAKITHESKLKGYNAGADDYLTKPFDPEILILKINRIMELRKNIQEQIIEKPDIIPQAINQKENPEKLFLENLYAIIEENIDNINLDVDYLSKELSISRSVLYEKIKILTDQPIAEFIKNYRLNKATKIIEKGESIISEVAWQVGFKSHAHFTRSFKQKYNCTPTEFKSKR